MLRPKAIKPLKEQMKQKFHNNRFGHDFLDIDTKGTGNNNKQRQIELHANFKIFMPQKTLLE